MYQILSKNQENVKEFTVTAEMVKKRDNVAELIQLPQKNKDKIENKEEIA